MTRVSDEEVTEYSHLRITYENDDGSIEKVVDIPGGCPTMILHGAAWVNLLVRLYDPRNEEDND